MAEMMMNERALEKLDLSCENATSELADILIDEKEKKKIMRYKI